VVSVVESGALMTQIRTTKTWVADWLELMVKLQREGNFDELTALWQSIVGIPKAEDTGNWTVWQRDHTVFQNHFPNIDPQEQRPQLAHSIFSEAFKFDGPVYFLTPKC